ncbi:hypothetical protein OIU35_04390 [Boseaceae bacterium BT-24-1]|nr:hypothetical protein [Boseaceae bacterium BT-24-1]
MLILFFKSVGKAGFAQEPLADKMRRILESHAAEARTSEERERAEKDLAKLEQPTVPAISQRARYRSTGE